MGYLQENAKKALAAVAAFNSDTGIEILKSLLLYDFGAEPNALLENALASLENFEYEGASENLKKIR